MAARRRWRLGLRRGVSEKPSEGLESIYQAMTLGSRDYVEKNGFPGLIGLSGGVDSGDYGGGRR